MSAELVPAGRPEWRDWLDELHTRLMADVKQHPPYAAGTVDSLSAYSEGAEHALDSVRLQAHKLRPARRVIRTVRDLTRLPHGLILLTSAQSVAQIQDDDDGHYLRYMGTDESDSLDPIDLLWNKMSRRTLEQMLPAVIIERP